MKRAAALEIVGRKHEKRNERISEDRRLERLKMKLEALNLRRSA